MTPKELLYVEDALGHEKFYETKCQELISKIQDPELKACVTDMQSKHKAIFNSMFGLL